MRLGTVLSGIPVLKSNVNYEVKIECIASDHRKVKENYIFVAINGFKRNGKDYIGLALENGATVIITQEKEACQERIPYVLVENARTAIARMWANYYSNPEKYIKTIAITGTNGKTSSAYYLFNIIRNAGISCGLISTIECLVNEERIFLNNDGAVCDISSNMTTPDPESLYYILYIMKKKNVKYVIMEASSHALKQNRIDGIDIEIGVFTNLTNEHLDYHINIKEYFKAKEKLMEMSKICVINADDKFGKCLLKKYAEKSMGISVNHKTDFYACNYTLNLNGSEYTLIHKDKKIKIKTDLIGKFNIYNSIVAASCGMILGIEDGCIVRGIKSLTKVKGRMERYKDKNIYIDYAHTSDAMKKVIELIKELEPQKRIITLFGCGGDRDKSKRADMGRISTTLADFSIITSDNSRGEDPEKIISDIEEGIVLQNKHIVIPNRKEAILYATKIMKNDDILLLLGKGHEEYEITSNGKEHFDEREILDEVFKA